MGIFQLIDYVGVDVFKCILEVMSGYLPNAGLHSDVIQTLVAKGVKGGQFANGAQKDGILRYDKSGLAGVYDLDGGRMSISIGVHWGGVPDSTNVSAQSRRVDALEEVDWAAEARSDPDALSRFSMAIGNAGRQTRTQLLAPLG